MEREFRNNWTDNANAISRLYTGTKALKTDITRHGKRTAHGQLNDASRSIRRYFINNFYDGYNHDCLDFVQRKLTVTSPMLKRGVVSPMRLTLLTIVGIEYAMSLVLSTYFPQPEANDSWKVFILHSMVYVMTFVAGAAYIFKNGARFVDEPSRKV